MMSIVSKLGQILNCHNIWILDPGVSDHVSPYIQKFQTNPIKVGFPNSNSLSSHFCGNIQLSNYLCLDSYLYLPKFHFNIISIFQFIKIMQYKIKLLCQFVYYTGLIYLEDDYKC